jgi:hypothetical protein
LRFSFAIISIDIAAGLLHADPVDGSGSGTSLWIRISEKLYEAPGSNIGMTYRCTFQARDYASKELAGAVDLLEHLLGRSHSFFPSFIRKTNVDNAISYYCDHESHRDFPAGDSENNASFAIELGHLYWAPGSSVASTH